MKLSVFVVTYNQEKYIRQCLDSILMQKVDFDYEVVIGEDHGTDGTRVICEEYAEKYPQVRLLPLMERLGIAGNWKRVLNECSGDYIAMCEGDDYWTDPLKLQKQTDFLESDNEKKYVLAFHDATIIDENGLVVESSKEKNNCSDRSMNDLKCAKHPSTQTVMFRREFLSEVLLLMRNYHLNSNDTVLFSILGKYGAGKYISDIKNSVWRIHKKSAWGGANLTDRLVCSFETFRYLANIHIELNEYYKKLCANIGRSLIRSASENKKWRIVRKYFISSLLYAIKSKSYCFIYYETKDVVINLLLSIRDCLTKYDRYVTNH